MNLNLSLFTKNAKASQIPKKEVYQDNIESKVFFTMFFSSFLLNVLLQKYLNIKYDTGKLKQRNNLQRNHKKIAKECVKNLLSVLMESFQRFALYHFRSIFPMFGHLGKRREIFIWQIQWLKAFRQSRDVPMFCKYLLHQLCITNT